MGELCLAGKEMKKTFSEKLWDKTGLSFWNDFVNIFRFWEYNWVNFRLIGFDIEWDKADNSFNLEIGLLGFNMRWQCALPGTTKQKEELLKRLADFKRDKQIKADK